MKMLQHQEVPPGDWWKIWLLNTGRAAGKTTAAINFTKGYLEQDLPVVYITNPRMQSFIAEQMIKELGGSAKFNKSKNRLICSSGTHVQFESADQPETFLHLRGKVYGALVWDDMECVRKSDLAIEILKSVNLLPIQPRIMLTISDTVPDWLNKYLNGKNLAMTRAESSANAANLNEAVREHLGISV